MLPPRHHQERSFGGWRLPQGLNQRIYSSAPCCGESDRTAPYLVKTVIVTQRRLPHYTYDSRGNRSCQRVLTTTYKDIYSDGTCYVWTEQG